MRVNGGKDKAIEHYEKFLDLWKDADPGIVEVEDARGKIENQIKNGETYDNKKANFYEKYDSCCNLRSRICCR